MLKFFHYNEVHDVTDQHLADYFYRIDFSNVKGTFSELTPEMFTQADFHEGFGQIDQYERAFMYNFIKKIKPKRGVLEFSPDQGASTALIGKALDTLEEKPKFFETHEISSWCADRTKEHLRQVGVQIPCEVKQGDVFDTMNREHLEQADFLFIDSDHRAEFCRRYAKEFLPLLKDCWVAVHDVVMHGPFANDESSIVREFVESRNVTDYFLVTDALKFHNIANPFRPWPYNPSFYFKVP